MRQTSFEHAAEMTRVRFWQEVALRSMQALIQVNPPPKASTDTATFRDWSQSIASMSWELAEKMFKGHGPAVEPGIVGLEKYVKDRVNEALAKVGH